ncbi:VacJ family lipoprotein [Marinobacter psychrophilus]|uniref:MlaA family lipoprotein n=1 Tax=Marinobacter psychrophilus TaxID=330734 RepID=UPI001B6B0B7A|nr:VacJ family lipoprotein [Marinobacter psychrophilus]MBQ0762784.1 VacJ family lipoprotein [Marinobacter psychrophilus]MBQ0844454.1 VacJ family lipoprotein [Marinobacter psychrophilus]
MIQFSLRPCSRLVLSCGALITLTLMLLFASGQAQAQESTQTADQRASAGFTESAPLTTNSSKHKRDPYENWNRKVFAFNESLDRWLLKPIAQTYRAIMPEFADRGVTNVFSNLGELGNFTNSVLQLKLESAVVAAGRFTFNTVFGLAGVFDVATAWDLPERPEDFGQTLGHWGAGAGSYLMLPVLGPSNPRDFAGFGVDSFLLPSSWDEIESPYNGYARGLQLVDVRSDLIPAEKLISGDRYVFVRNAFMQRREFLINDGKVQRDPFAADDSDDLMLDDF